ncbi:MAG: hypothetical protein R3C44_22080 [Chloroflexota bacterium]
MTGSRSDEVQRAVMACGDDGIWDLSIGAILLIPGIVELLAWDSIWELAVVPIIPLVLLAKRQMTAVRLTDYETRHSLPGSIRMAVWLLAFVTLILLALLGTLAGLSYTGQIPPWLADMLPITLPVTLALLGVIIMVTVGTMVNAAGRYFLYAGVLAIGFLALLWDATPTWTAFVIPGALMVLIGLGCSMRFVRTHPVRPPERRLRFRF